MYEPTSVPRSRVVEALRARPLTWFYVLVFAVSWPIFSLFPILGWSISNPTQHLLLMPGIAFGATGVAFFMTAVTQGRPGVRRLLQRLVQWRVGPPWVAVAVLLFPVGIILVTAAMGYPDILRALAPSALVFYPAAYLAHLFFGPLFEEAGWRGFALPRLQHRFGPLRATLVLGLLWSAWHWILYVPGWAAAGVSGVVMGATYFAVLTLAFAVTFTWLSNNTRGSLLVCVLLHASIDVTPHYLQALAAQGIISADAVAFCGLWGVMIVGGLVAMVVLVATRGRLGYPRYQVEAEQLDLDPAAQPASPRRIAS